MRVYFPPGDKPVDVHEPQFIPLKGDMIRLEITRPAVRILKYTWKIFSNIFVKKISKRIYFLQAVGINEIIIRGPWFVNQANQNYVKYLRQLTVEENRNRDPLRDAESNSANLQQLFGEEPYVEEKEEIWC